MIKNLEKTKSVKLLLKVMTARRMTESKTIYNAKISINKAKEENVTELEKLVAENKAKKAKKK